MDESALRALADERIDWRYKGFPARFDGLTVGRLIEARPPLAEFGTPLLVLEAGALDHNLSLMAQYCAAHGVDLAPHGKTTMAPQLFARQLDSGAWAITAATIAHVRAYRAFGVDTIVLANQLVDADSLGWVAGELRRSARFRLLCFADSVAGVERMQAALAAADAPRPIDVVIDIGASGGRTGCRDAETAETVARAIRPSDRLRLAGVGGFEGALAADRSAQGLARVRGYLRTLRDIATRLDTAGLFDQVDEIIVTAGGSAYFDDVVEILTGDWRTSLPVRTLLRSGAYITHDDGHYRRLTPLPQSEPSSHAAGGFRAALSIRGRVLSMPEPGLALLDFGKRDAPIDLGMPEPHTVHRPDGTTDQLTDCSVKALADQHAFLAYGDGTRLSIGDVVACGISHPCTAFDKWQLIAIVEGGHVVDVIRTFF
ncbi:MAG TPA: alanine racemase [Actinocrinis sp.]|uniref:alanine racemase n=1 Tax=Actinocrinis sp. TaxID=1920516 RepID=UPI002DDCF28C|nr:alanine racemase [Actinocrinis sp.]HEV2342509.1 alanine racemase [Actinocrinis sp.]